MTEKALSFFRIFDLAFFLPGAMVFLAIVLRHDLLVRIASPPGIPTSVVLTVGIFIAVYLLGLLLHGLQRLITDRLRRWGIRSHDDPAPWFLDITRQRREELILYLWYLRATCWNCALATLAAAAILLIGTSFSPGWWCLAVVAFFLLVYLGWDFERSWSASCAGIRQSEK